MGLKIVRILSWILVALIVILSIILLFPVYWPITVYFLIVSLISIWFFKYDYNKHKDIALFEFFVLLISITIVFLLGVGWEIFEYFWDLIVTVKFGGIPAQSSRMDTLLDLISDLLGGILGVLICLIYKMKNK